MNFFKNAAFINQSFILGLGLASTLLVSPTLGFSKVDESKLEVMEAYSKAPHEMAIFDHGVGSLYERLKMIERAKESIELEYFIFDTSSSSRIFIQALAKKAKEGVKVRVLLDYFLIIPEVDVYHAHILKEAGIEVRYYNVESIVKLLKYQYRSHRKLLLVDGVEAMTGGRNIADEYFDLKTDFNFIDKDLLVKGPIVKNIKESFEVFWNHPLTSELNIEKAKELEARDLAIIQDQFSEMNETDLGLEAIASHDKLLKRNYKIYKNAKKKEVEKWEKAKKFLKETDEDRALLQKVMELGQKMEVRTPKGVCENVAFGADYPGYGSKYRKVKGLRKLVNKYMREAKSELIIDSPYFIPDKESRSALNQAIENKAHVRLLTNSLYSTDAIYVNAVFNSIASRWIKKGVETHIFKGEIPGNYPVLTNDIRKARFGTHTKSFAYDKKDFMIGTYNFDPRSTKFNAELAVFCFDQPELTKEMIADFNNKVASSHYLKTPKDLRKHKLDKITFGKKVLYYVIKPFALLFRNYL